jgi:hypothetical protein
MSLDHPFEREMNLEERNALGEALHASVDRPGYHKMILWGVAWLGLAVASPVAGLFVLSRFSSVLVLVVAMVPLFVVFLISVFVGGNIIRGAISIRGFATQQLRTGIPKINAALRDGKVLVFSAEADSVIEFEEFDDEGAGFLFSIKGGTSLLLKGQHVFPADGKSDWPNTKFDIVRSSTHDLWIGIFCSGVLLPPSRVIPLAECVEDFVWDSFEKHFDKSADQVLATLLKNPSSAFPNP